MHDVQFAAGVTPVGEYWIFDGYEGSFFPQCVTWVVDFACIYNNLLCVRDVFVGNLLVRAVA